MVEYAKPSHYALIDSENPYRTAVGYAAEIQTGNASMSDVNQNTSLKLLGF